MDTASSSTFTYYETDTKTGNELLEPQYFGLSAIALTAVVVVGLFLAAGIPLLYVAVTYKGSKILKVKSQTTIKGAGRNDVESNRGKHAYVTDMQVYLPKHDDYNVRARAREMQEIRTEALTAANISTEYREPASKICMLNVDAYVSMPKEDAEWLQRGIEKCKKWKIVTDPDQLSNTSSRSIESMLSRSNFDLKAWKAKLRKWDLSKVTLPRPPSVHQDSLPAKPTEDDVTKLDKINQELAMLEAKRRSNLNFLDQK